ncbi:hypothetical protein ACIOC1_25635 [Streptomyces sp. NPDC088197]|uniref:hypothetical protein n=1 Tax=Streptomyces sp. NPDC088197 TaxID=3365840 RepID=UPI0038290A16
MFGDGQTALRRALTSLVHAATYSNGVAPDFRELVENAATLRAASTPTANERGSGTTTAEFVMAIQDILDFGKNARPNNPRVDLALQRLEMIVADYKAWANATR